MRLQFKKREIGEKALKLRENKILWKLLFSFILIMSSLLTVGCNLICSWFPELCNPLGNTVTMVSEYSTALPTQRKLVRTTDGHLHVVYHRKDNHGIFQVFHAESSDNGVTWKEEQVTFANKDQCFPALASDSSGNLHLVWNDGWPSEPGITPNVYYRKKTVDGWQPPELVASYAAYPSLAIDSQDNVHVVYGAYVYEPGYWGGGNGIRWRLRTAEGWQAEESISAEKQWARYPSVAIDSNDNVHVVWNHAPRYRFYDVHYRKKTASRWETEVEISRDSDSTAPYPVIAIDNQDCVHIVWHQQEGASYNTAQDGYWSIRHRVYTDSWQPVEILAGPTKFLQVCPTMAIDDRNQIHVVWAGRTESSPSIYQLQYKKFEATGWHPTRQLTSSLNNQEWPNLVWAFYPLLNGDKINQPADGFIAVWVDGMWLKYYSTAK
jgi:hypothetical protein